MTVELCTRIGPGFTTTPTFTTMFFPAGEAHVKVANDNNGKGPLTEVARMCGASHDNLFTLAMWADACHRRAGARHAADPSSEPNRTVLLLPYLPGARADHDDFVPYGVGVYADHLNSLGVDQVICVNPHSPVAPSLLNGVTVIGGPPAPQHRPPSGKPARTKTNLRRPHCHAPDGDRPTLRSI